MRHIKVVMENGHEFDAAINGTNESICKYYNQGPLDIGSFPVEKMVYVWYIIFMDELKTYNVSFSGRLNGAIGIAAPMTKQVLANNPEQAKLRLYKEYEHISRGEATETV